MYFSGIENDLLSWQVKFDSHFNTASGSESCPSSGRDPSDSPTSQYYSLLELVDAVSKWLQVSSKSFDSSICDWKNKFSLFGKYHFFRMESFRVDFRCVHRFQLLKVCNQDVTLLNSPDVQCISEERSK